MEYWKHIKFFKPEEFISPRDSDATLAHGYNMNQQLIEILDSIREDIGVPLKINSGYRSPAYNKEIGGVSNSQHTKYRAVDIHIDSQEQGDIIEGLARNLGIKGVGRYNSFIHLDVRDGNTAYWDNRNS